MVAKYKLYFKIVEISYNRVQQNTVFMTAEYLYKNIIYYNHIIISSVLMPHLSTSADARIFEILKKGAWCVFSRPGY